MAKSADIKLSTIRVYESKFKTFLSRSNISLQENVKLSLFHGVHNGYTTYTSHELSIIRFYYKQILNKLVFDKNYSKKDIISLCLDGMWDIDKEKKIGVQFENVTQIYELLLNGVAEACQIAEAFFLPSDFFEDSIPLPASIYTPHRSWWDEDFLGLKNVKRRKEVKLLWQESELDPESKESFMNFKSAMDLVRRGEHSSGKLRRIWNHRRDNAELKPKFTERLIRELDDLKSYKTGRDRQGRMPKNIWRSPASQNIDIYYAERFLVYCYNHFINHFKITEEDAASMLTIGLLSISDLVIDFIENIKAISGDYNSSCEKIYQMSRSYTNEDHGWLTLNDYFFERIPKEYKSAGENVEWRQHCAASSKKLKAYYNNRVKPLRKPTRLSKDCIKQLLDKDEPLKYMFEALEVSRLELLSRWEPTEKFAYEAQCHIIVFMMTCFPLRCKNWSTMTHYRFDSRRGHLRMPEGGFLEIVIPVRNLKNWMKNKDLDGVDEIRFEYSHPPYPLHQLEFVRRYLNELRPLITNGHILFIKSSGEAMSHWDISEKVFKWTSKYISSESRYRTRIPGLPPFRAHAIRSIVATHFSKQGDPGTAALLLLDSEAVIRKHYLHDNINSKIKRRLRSIQPSSFGLTS
ncbi:hypothetical protein [uncultured Deinococcus sp.]|uniref:hypothetical protein n=1 Tax=uncultured Deinococcus sp. TaxID=158789 RepID=UPI0025DE6931|nr:hypothetical protein [uncultured Deinococcus sp.]